MRETLNVLRQTDKELYWHSVNKIKKAAEPLADSIDAYFPEAPPGRGWNHSGRTGWNQTKKTVIQYGGRRSSTMKRNQTWNLVKVKVMDAPRQIFDMAGSKNPGNPLDRAMSKNWGSASRAVWRAADKGKPKADAAVKEACREVQAKLNKRLKVVR